MRLLLLCFLMLLGWNVLSQNTLIQTKDSSVIIGDIIISGNKKTKTNIILREMFFKVGDTIAANQLEQKVEQSRQLIFNTSLFVDVVLHTAKLDSNKVSVIVLVKERWYIFPLPYFKLVDRNFNDWWVNQHRDFSRVNYGIKFTQYNFTGNRDKLSVYLLTGYNRQVSFNYELPFSNKKLTNGFSVGYTYSQQKELNYLTSSENKQLFFKLQDGFARTFSRYDVAFVHRPNKFYRHTFRVGYTAESVADSIIIKNGTYYGDGVKRLQYADFSYTLQYTNTNYNAYPTNGFIGVAYFQFKAFSNHSSISQIITTGLFAKPLSRKSFVRTRFGATIKFPYTPSFINQPLFGYGDFLIRGLEYYVVDGMAGAFEKTTLATSLFTANLKLPVNSKTYNNIPFNFYGKIYNDIGYSYNPYINNNLNNKLLCGYGIGIDIVTIYDIVLKFEYSFNQLGGKGFFLGGN